MNLEEMIEKDIMENKVEEEKEQKVVQMQEQADEMRNRIFQCKSYHSALSIIGDYVNITSAHQEECMDMEME